MEDILLNYLILQNNGAQQNFPILKPSCTSHMKCHTRSQKLPSYTCQKPNNL